MLLKHRKIDIMKRTMTKKPEFKYVKIDDKKLVKIAEKMQPAIIELAKS
jgi:sulfur transfer complex TusBCD TusB component (DsrH family)